MRSAQARKYSARKPKNGIPIQMTYLDVSRGRPRSAIASWMAANVASRNNSPVMITSPFLYWSAQGVWGLLYAFNFDRTRLPARVSMLPQGPGVLDLMRASEACISFIKEAGGFRSEACLDAGCVLAIGYGETATSRQASASPRHRPMSDAARSTPKLSAN